MQTSREVNNAFSLLAVAEIVFWGAAALLSPVCDIQEAFSLELTVDKQYIMNQWEKKQMKQSVWGVCLGCIFGVEEGRT